MNKMIKRRKDDGFTLIELMIVIAVIGILAVVLVPKVGSIKTSAKQSGIDVNMRTVQAYCTSQIDKWSAAGADQSDVANEINGVVTTGTNSMTNPLDNLTTTAFTTDATGKIGATVTKGVVFIQSVSGTGSGYTVTIAGIDNSGNVYKTTAITP